MKVFRVHTKDWEDLPKVFKFKYLMLDFELFGTSRGGKGLKPVFYIYPVVKQLVNGYRSKYFSHSSQLVPSKGPNDTACLEQLLVHCAAALEASEVSFAQQAMWMLNNIASTEGEPNQRVASWFLRALAMRASRMLPSFNTDAYLKYGDSDFIYRTSEISSTNPLGEMFPCFSLPNRERLLNPVQLAKFLDLTPWYRFGFSAANGAILQALEGSDHIHILDLSITHCMQWPTLIEALSTRPSGPPQSMRLSVLVSRPSVPPFLEVSYDQLGHRLCMFARSKGINLEFHTIESNAEELEPCMLNLREGEALAVNFQLRLHYISQESSSYEVSESELQDIDHLFTSDSPRDRLLDMIRSLNPNIVIVVEEDVDLTQDALVERVRVAFNYFWIPFDLLESCLPRNHELRMQYEEDVGKKIENIVAYDGGLRIERMESKDMWIQRLRFAEFRQVEFGDQVAGDVKSMLEQHATGWGLKREEGSLVLTWKGHNVVFATAWII